MTMPYLAPVPAAFHMARDRHAHAAQQPSWTETFGRVLARSLEFAVQGVLISWGHPVAPSKTHEPFETLLAAHLPTTDTALIQLIWTTEGSANVKPETATTITDSAAIIGRLEHLANTPAPPWWSPPPTPAPIGWADLDPAEQDVLRQALSRARNWCPQARVILFGSRAKGSAQQDSDFDLLVILPDDFDDRIRGQIIGDLYTLGTSLGVTIGREAVTQSAWNNPTPADTVLLDQVKAYGIEVPEEG